MLKRKKTESGIKRLNSQMQAAYPKAGARQTDITSPSLTGRDRVAQTVAPADTESVSDYDSIPSSGDTPYQPMGTFAA